jgi:hypothetical protein
LIFIVALVISSPAAKSAIISNVALPSSIVAKSINAAPVKVVVTLASVQEVNATSCPDLDNFNPETVTLLDATSI